MLNCYTLFTFTLLYLKHTMTQLQHTVTQLQHTVTHIQCTVTHIQQTMTQLQRTVRILFCCSVVRNSVSSARVLLSQIRSGFSELLFNSFSIYSSHAAYTQTHTFKDIHGQHYRFLLTSSN